MWFLYQNLDFKLFTIIIYNIKNLPLKSHIKLRNMIICPKISITLIFQINKINVKMKQQYKLERDEELRIEEFYYF